MSQADKLLTHFKQGKPITIMESFNKFGITSLHRRLSDLKERGYEIRAEWIDLQSGKKVKRYWLKSDE